MKSQQIDSSHLPEKIAIRTGSLPNVPDDIRVLDLFAGQGEVWKEITARTKRPIKVVRVDKKKIPDVVRGDNLKIIPRLDLSRYHIIDCDSYGDAFEQIAELFENKSLRAGTIIHYTYMRVGFPKIRIRLLSQIGIGKDMIRICPSLFSNLGYPAFLEFLRVHGVKTVWETTIQENRWVYGYFFVAKQGEREYTLSNAKGPQKSMYSKRTGKTIQ